MEKFVIAKLGVEGGGATIFGQQVDGVWSFWQESMSIFLDENDDEDWRSWTTDPVAELSSALPDKWWLMHPSGIHPKFVDQLRREYESLSEQDCGPAGRSPRSRWEDLFEGLR